MNTLCFVLVMLCIVALLSNNIDALQLCYEMGKGTAYTDATQKSFLIKTLIRAVDMNILLIAGILLIIVVSKINKGLVFVWQNITLFRWIGYLWVFTLWFLLLLIMWKNRHQRLLKETV